MNLSQEARTMSASEASSLFADIFDEEEAAVQAAKNDQHIAKLNQQADMLLQPGTELPQSAVESIRKDVDDQIADILSINGGQDRIPLLRVLARIKLGLKYVKIKPEESRFEMDGNGTREYPFTLSTLDLNAHSAAKNGSESFFRQNGITIRVVGNEKIISLVDVEDVGQDQPEYFLNETAKILGYKIVPIPEVLVSAGKEKRYSQLERQAIRDRYQSAKLNVAKRVLRAIDEQGVEKLLGKAYVQKEEMIRGILTDPTVGIENYKSVHMSPQISSDNPNYSPIYLHGLDLNDYLSDDDKSDFDRAIAWEQKRQEREAIYKRARELDLPVDYDQLLTILSDVIAQYPLPESN